MLIMIIPVILLNIPALQNLLLLALKEKWRPMLPLLPFLSLGAWFTGLNIMFNPLFLVRNKFKPLVMLYGSNLILLIGLILILVPAQGLIGAARSVLIARILLQPFYIWQAIRTVRGKRSEI
jgi:O-antigen/teichoic acid export membrane protein